MKSSSSGVSNLFLAKLTMLKATFGDWACQCVSFDFIRLKVPYERENDLINFFSKIGRSIKYTAIIKFRQC